MSCAICFLEQHRQIKLNIKRFLGLKTFWEPPVWTEPLPPDSPHFYTANRSATVFVARVVYYDYVVLFVRLFSVRSSAAVEVHTNLLGLSSTRCFSVYHYAGQCSRDGYDTEFTVGSAPRRKTQRDSSRFGIAYGPAGQWATRLAVRHTTCPGYKLRLGVVGDRDALKTRDARKTVPSSNNPRNNRFGDNFEIGRIGFGNDGDFTFPQPRGPVLPSKTNSPPSVFLCRTIRTFGCSIRRLITTTHLTV